MDEDIVKLGPLAALAGTWEGNKGDDLAPATPDRNANARSKFRERLTLEPIGRVDNHEQVLYGLRYATQAWRIGEENPFHEEVGYWLWDAERELVMRCFMVPRGISVIAGGKVAPAARQFKLTAEQGSATFGICSNPFLDQEFKTLRYELEITVHDPQSFSYHENTVLQIKGRPAPLDHVDQNTLRRVTES